MFKTLSLRLVLAGALLGAAACASAQTYPAKTIRLISPVATGGTGDTIARLMAAEIARGLGQPVVVESRPASGGNVGFEAVAKAPPDGHTLVLGSPALVINPSLRAHAGYTLADFAPVSVFANTAQVLVVHPSLPVANLQELIAHARRNPGKLNYGSAGVGSLTHLNMELFQSMAGTQIVHVPFQGSSPMRTGLIAGQIQVAIDGLMPALPFIRDGRLKAIAMVDGKRSEVAPEIATMDEAGLKGYASDTWYGLLAPAGTPAPVLQALQGVLARVAREPEVRSKLLGQGAATVGSSTAEFRTLLERESARWSGIIKSAGIKPE